MYAHGAVAAKHLGVELFHAVISEQWREAPVKEEVMATLVFLEKMTLRPTALEVSDVHTVMGAGVERIDIEHAVMVASMFHSMNRLVDAFGADLTEEESGRLGAMLNFGGVVLASSGRKKDPPFGDALPGYVEKILQPICKEQGDSPVELRRAIVKRLYASQGVAFAVEGEASLPSDLGEFVDLIGEDVWGLTDEHFEGLKHSGWSEEAIYEFVYTASMAAGLVRLQIAWELISSAL